MQLDPNRELLWMFVKRIVDEAFPGQSGGSRLQKMGLFLLIYILERDPPVTAARIAELTRQSQSQIHRQLQQLVDLKLVERKKILNKTGRGRAYALAVKHTKETERLLKAIGKATPSRK